MKTRKTTDNPSSIQAQPHRQKPKSLSLEQLNPGDILLFRPSVHYYPIQGLIQFMQMLINRSHGHYDTTHVAICVGRNEKGEIMLGHTAEKKDVMGYIKETLTEMLSRDHHDRPFIVFRPKNLNFAAKIAEIAGNREENKHIKWSISTAIRVLFTRNTTTPEKKRSEIGKLSPKHVCSSFVTECLQKSAIVTEQVIPPLNTYLSPKGLESYLASSEDFTVHCYLGKRPIEKLVTEINHQLKRIAQRRDPASQLKYKNIQAMLARQVFFIDDHPELSDLDKALCLLKPILPALNRSTGLGWTNTTSFNAIRSVARGMGIFDWRIKDFTLPSFSSKGEDEKNEVKMNLKFN